MSVKEATFGPRHPQLKPPLEALAELYAGQGRKARVEAAYQRIAALKPSTR